LQFTSSAPEFFAPRAAQWAALRGEQMAQLGHLAHSAPVVGILAEADADIEIWERIWPEMPALVEPVGARHSGGKLAFGQHPVMGM